MRLKGVAYVDFFIGGFFCLFDEGNVLFTACFCGTRVQSDIYD